MKAFLKSLPALAVLAGIVFFSLQPSPDANAAADRPRWASETMDFASAADGVGETGSITVKGAKLGDACLATAGVDLQDMLLTCYVQSANTVEYRLQNESTATVNLASTTVRVVVFPSPQF